MLSCRYRIFFDNFPRLLFWMAHRCIPKISKAWSDFCVILASMKCRRSMPSAFQNIVTNTFYAERSRLHFFGGSEPTGSHSLDWSLVSGVSIVADEFRWALLFLRVKIVYNFESRSRRHYSVATLSRTYCCQKENSLRRHVRKCLQCSQNFLRNISLVLLCVYVAQRTGQKIGKDTYWTTLV